MPGWKRKHEAEARRHGDQTEVWHVGSHWRRLRPFRRYRPRQGWRELQKALLRVAVQQRTTQLDVSDVFTEKLTRMQDGVNFHGEAH
eukprot:51669-Chlamydomonas_euryale.AAC.2